MLFRSAAAGVFTLVWRTVGDSCPFCRTLDGSVVSVQSNFIDAGETFDADGADTPLQPDSAIGHPPAHPGCDCMVSPGG